MKGRHSFRPFIAGGLPMAINAYTHLKDTKVPVFITLYTAFLIYLDDVLCHNLDAVSEFNERLTTGKVQKDFMLDHFATLINEFSQHFPRIVYNIMLSSTMNFVTALLLEKETEEATIHRGATGYPTLVRSMSGASEVFALAIFPPCVPVINYVQVLPELVIFINNGKYVNSRFMKRRASA
ncbi:hypothetical protein K435DRAFT_674887 [Dendrothele bispora CBS 962.96]|uniref:Uncharacterized protein n=1 Tax=Dendrothele bispora (strain CBS 962.96) TaxID=1314807 RepID=A0A4S8LP02_DENBC|nr:hypothetical protein K435DRAFT_674887 [Dendrothele bispora CBS 962.96]